MVNKVTRIISAEARHEASLIVDHLVYSGVILSNSPQQMTLHFGMDSNPPLWEHVVKKGEPLYDITHLLDTGYKTLQKLGMANSIEFLMDYGNRNILIANVAKAIQSVPATFSSVSKQLDGLFDHIIDLRTKNTMALDALRLLKVKAESSYITNEEMLSIVNAAIINLEKGKK